MAKQNRNQISSTQKANRGAKQKTDKRPTHRYNDGDLSGLNYLEEAIFEMDDDDFEDDDSVFFPGVTSIGQADMPEVDLSDDEFK
ncbi:MAG: hypothetical protein WC453_01050 [Patescibacteria group bacterium]